MTVAFKTFKEWMLHQYEYNQLADICRCGAESGFIGLIYNHETTALYDRYHEEIWAALYEDYQDSGLDSCLELISTFGGAKDVMSDEQYKNLLVWHLAGRIAYEVTEGKYLSDDVRNNVSNAD